MLCYFWGSVIKCHSPSTPFTRELGFRALRHKIWSPIQFSSVSWPCLTLCNPMDYSMPGFPVHHQLLELTQIHVHWVGDAIQHLLLCHPLLLLPPIFPSIRVFSNESGGQSIGVSASVLPMNIQDWFPLGWTAWISLQSKGLSKVFNTRVQNHQFFGAQFSLWSNSHYPKTAVLKRTCVLQLFQPFSARHQIYDWSCPRY